MGGCETNGQPPNVDLYSRPLPWIGLYIAAASLICAAAMAFDAYSGFRRRKLWFPSRLFSLNATTLTLLGVATKFAVDLNTPMPGRADQLSKLSGTVLICTVMGNFMPSMGEMDDANIVSNVVALVILVVTVVVNVCMQMGTGVIFVFLPEHVIVILLVMVLLVLFVSSALTVDTTKELLENQYISKHNKASADETTGSSSNKYSLLKLQSFVKQRWLMAHTSSPQYVLGRSVTCSASGAFCLLGALILAQALLRSFFRGSHLKFCTGQSDYRWSTTLVLIAQVAAVLIGTVGPAYRWFYAVNFRSPESESANGGEFKVEEYWVKRLKDWRETPLSLKIRGRRFGRIAHDLKNYVLALLIRLQGVVVLGSKVVRLAAVLPISWLRKGVLLFRKMGTACPAPRPDDEDKDELKDYVLHLDGEEDLLKLITRSERKDTDRWIEKGRRRKPGALLFLIRKYSTISQGFTEVGTFDHKCVPSLVREEPPNCWALPVVTLATIAVAVPGVDKPEVKSLLRGVKSGLKFVRLVDTFLDETGVVNMREAAEIVWLRLYLYRQWFDLDLCSSASNTTNGRKIIEKIERNAKKRVEAFSGQSEAEKSTLTWPPRVLAANCMYRVCATILRDYDHGKHKANTELFSRLRCTISDTLGACLTNLPEAIHLESFSNRIEVRERRVREAALTLGAAWDILQRFEDPQVAELVSHKTSRIDDWREEGQVNP